MPTRSALTSDHYATLGVSPDADGEEVARAYRSAAKALHPDRYGGDLARFQELTVAWEALRDPELRAEYDRGRSDGPVSRPAPSRHTGMARRRAPRTPSRGGALLMVWAGAFLALVGVAAAVLTAALMADSARFRDESIAVTATVVDGPGGSEVLFTTREGEVVQVPEPEPDNPNAAGVSLGIRYAIDDPTEVRVDESTLARDITVGIVALKLLIGGPVLIVVGARRLAA